MTKPVKKSINTFRPGGFISIIKPYDYWVEHGWKFGIAPDEVKNTAVQGRRFIKRFVDINCYLQ
jgi:hypothetical protein